MGPTAFRLLKASIILTALMNFSSFVSASDKNQYVGCFKMGEVGKIIIFEEMGPKQCRQQCYKAGYYYAGLKSNGVCECYEGEPLSEDRLPRNKCKEVCDNGNECGIFHTGPKNEVDNFDTSLGHIGCFSAESIRRLMSAYDTAKMTMTPYLCVSTCQSKGYAYAGVKGRDQCMCGNIEPYFYARVSSEMCNQRCAGDITLLCGGHNEITVYNTGVIGTENLGIDITLAFEGCYLTTSTTLKEYTHYNDLGPKQCVRHCTENNLLFAHLYNGAYCYCSNNQPKADARLHLSQCSTPCAGESQYQCGSSKTHMIYRTPVREHDLGIAYMGCYVDVMFRKLGGKQSISRDMTPSTCIATCSQSGYAFAGLQFSYQCFCGNEKPSPDDKRPEGECSTPCEGDPQQICGGTWRNSIYKTNHRAPGIDTLLNYFGCFEDKIIRKLKGSFQFKNTMTPALCVKWCTQKNYQYAGVQNGNQCFCGNETPLDKDKALDEECKKPCAGNSKYICGGWFRNSIYVT